jgi:hypothetical protein
MATAAERQAKWLARQQAAGMVSVTVLVPSEHAAQIRMVAGVLRADADLEIAMLRRRSTGQMVKSL